MDDGTMAEYECKICGYKGKTREAMREHIRESHSEIVREDNALRYTAMQSGGTVRGWFRNFRAKTPFPEVRDKTIFTETTMLSEALQWGFGGRRILYSNLKLRGYPIIYGTRTRFWKNTLPDELSYFCRHFGVDEAEGVHSTEYKIFYVTTVVRDGQRYRVDVTDNPITAMEVRRETVFVRQDRRGRDIIE